MPQALICLRFSTSIVVSLEIHECFFSLLLGIFSFAICRIAFLPFFHNSLGLFSSDHFARSSNLFSMLIVYSASIAVKSNLRDGVGFFIFFSLFLHLATRTSWSLLQSAPGYVLTFFMQAFHFWTIII